MSSDFFALSSCARRGELTREELLDLLDQGLINEAQADQLDEIIVGHEQYREQISAALGLPQMTFFANVVGEWIMPGGVGCLAGWIIPMGVLVAIQYPLLKISPNLKISVHPLFIGLPSGVVGMLSLPILLAIVRKTLVKDGRRGILVSLAVSLLVLWLAAFSYGVALSVSTTLGQ
jgi:hypothetical protein